MVNLVFYPKPSEDDLIAIIKEINEAESLLVQGLFREKELNDLTVIAFNLYDISSDHDTIQYRKYDKSRRVHTTWKPASNRGYVDMSDASELMDLKQQIIELLNSRNIEVEPSEVFLPPNSEFKSRTVIRNILSLAYSSIDIKDDNLFSANPKSKNIEILEIVAPYLSTTLTMGLRMLGSHDNPHNSVTSDIKAFQKQYQDTSIKGYSHSSSGTRQTHDRFIVIDKKDVYKIGTSLKDLGLSQSSIDKVNDQNIASSYIVQFEEWWKLAIKYPDIV